MTAKEAHGDLSTTSRLQASTKRWPAQRRATFIAGGTTLVDLMKLNVLQPQSAGRHQRPAAGQRRDACRTAGLRIGALVRNSDLAWNHDT